MVFGPNHNVGRTVGTLGLGIALGLGGVACGEGSGEMHSCTTPDSLSPSYPQSHRIVIMGHALPQREFLSDFRIIAGRRQSGAQGIEYSEPIWGATSGVAFIAGEGGDGSQFGLRLILRYSGAPPPACDNQPLATFSVAPITEAEAQIHRPRWPR